MKIPLRFQITEYDCGAVSLLNALSFLYERENIPALFVKQIYKYTLDEDDSFGNSGNGGTSRGAMTKFVNWVARYTQENDFGLNCQKLEGEAVSPDNIKSCLQKGGVVLARCWLTNEHYIIITKIKGKKVYIFDPYYFNKNHYARTRQVKIITNKPFTHNRIVSMDRVFSQTTKDFSLGPTKDRECVLINKK